MFLTITKKTVITVIVCCLLLVFGVAFVVPVNMPTKSYTVVIDAGHGGIDGGSVGKTTGVTESSLNLKYTFKLKEKFENLGFRVILTRSDMNGLYEAVASNKKKSDMQKRKEIIESSNADMVISIHMNSSTLKSPKGAQVFYKLNDAAGKAFAESIQKAFIEKLPNAKKTPLAGDYFMVNCTPKPSVIVECGFLSNAEEEKRLISEEYMDLVCESIVGGTILFLGV